MNISLSGRYFSLAGILVFVIMATGVACSGNSGEAGKHEKSAAEASARNDWSGAIVEYSKAIELDPKSDRAYEGRGIAYRESKQWDKAIADFTRAVEIAPDRGGPYFERGVTYHIQGYLDKAIADFSQAIGDISKTSWRSALYERGLAYTQKGELDKAKADFQRILELEAKNPSGWAERAQKALGNLAR